MAGRRWRLRVPTTPLEVTWSDALSWHVEVVALAMDSAGVQGALAQQLRRHAAL